jgi:hypothetical protein
VLLSAAVLCAPRCFPLPAAQHAEMQPDDNAFVVARLQLPIDPSDTAAVAAAWPPDTLGFGHLGYPDASAPGTTQQQQQLQQQEPEMWAPAGPDADADAPPAAATLTSLDSWLPTDAAAASDTVTTAVGTAPVGPRGAMTAGGAVQQQQQQRQQQDSNRAASSPGAISSFPLYGVVQSAMRSAGSGYLSQQPAGQGTEQEDMAGAVPRGGTTAPGSPGGAGGGGGQQAARRSVRVVPPGIPGGVVYHPGEGGAPARK